jgi:predicted dehydrogenase
MNDKKKKISNAGRRQFIKNSSLFLGGISIVPRHVLGRGFVAPSDKINLGVIGLGKQGIILSDRFLGRTQAQIVAGSDVWPAKCDNFKTKVQEFYAKSRNVESYTGVEAYADYQELLERKDIDGVIITTPDHWHAIQSIDAMNKGKDVYCEKPLTHRISDGQEMVKAAKENGTIVQVGSMQRSWYKFKTGQEMVSAGQIGEIKQVLVNAGDPARPYDLPVEPTPKALDWNKWCGPAPLVTYNELLAPEIITNYPKWRWFKEFAGGILADFGAHMFDIAQWYLGMDRSGPVHYIPPADRTAKRGLKMIYENGIEMIHQDFNRGYALRFIGTEGVLDVGRGFLETLPSKIVNAHPGSTNEKPFSGEGNHYQDWLSSMKTRIQPICDVETGHRTATVCNVANIAYELGRPLEWDPVAEKFKGDAEANGMCVGERREFG